MGPLVCIYAAGVWFTQIFYVNPEAQAMGIGVVGQFGEPAVRHF